MRPAGAIRAGDQKLVEWFEDGRIEVYNLTADPGESKNLATEEPELTMELLAMLRSWRKEVGAQMPSKNSFLFRGRATTRER